MKTKTKKEIITNQTEILYENTEYGFTFTLPTSWDHYQIVSDSWEGISIDQQQIENGQIL